MATTKTCCQIRRNWADLTETDVLSCFINSFFFSWYHLFIPVFSLLLLSFFSLFFLYFLLPSYFLFCFFYYLPFFLWRGVQKVRGQGKKKADVKRDYRRHSCNDVKNQTDVAKDWRRRGQLLVGYRSSCREQRSRHLLALVLRLTECVGGSLTLTTRLHFILSSFLQCSRFSRQTHTLSSHSISKLIILQKSSGVDESSS